MATFTYTARTRGGDKTEGVVEAPDRRVALAQLEQQGYVPIAVTESGAASESKTSARRVKRSRKRMTTRDVLTFSMELSDLLASGMTLGNALGVLANRETGHAEDMLIRGLRDDIVQGSSLSSALAKQPASFSPLYVNMIRAGEASGALSEVLMRLVEHYERLHEVKEKIVTALVYPAIVLLVGFATLAVCTFFIIPKFTVILQELNATLPLSTRILMGTSKWLVRYGWLVAAATAMLLVMANRAVKTEKGQLWWHGFLLRLPVVRGVLSAGIYANFAQTLGTLLSNGVPVLEALAIVEQALGNKVIGNEIRNARDRVTDGTTISGPLEEGKVFPKIMTDMMAIGEQTGNVPGALTHVARRYQHELDRSIKIMTTILEPLLITIMAVIVGFVAYGLWSAVSSITTGMDA